jgi:uncharacterized membrane protein
MNQIRVLLAGESWISYGIHVKGFAAYTTGFYEEGLTPLAQALIGFADLVYLPNHQANLTFPNTAAELDQFDAVLLSDIPSDTLLLHPDTFNRSIVRPNRLKAIQEYVEHGGGFGMIGGYMSFSGFEGKANYRNTPIARILPILMDGRDDRIESPEGIIPRITDRQHPILHEIPDDWPPLLGYNRFSAKPEGNVLLYHGEDPILVTGSYGSGRTFAYASDCSPHWGTPQFVNWQYYQPFWRQLVSWLSGDL